MQYGNSGNTHFPLDVASVHSVTFAISLVIAVLFVCMTLEALVLLANYSEDFFKPKMLQLLFSLKSSLLCI